jgi:hypothetical protein
LRNSAGECPPARIAFKAPRVASVRPRPNLGVGDEPLLAVTIFMLLDPDV